MGQHQIDPALDGWFATAPRAPKSGARPCMLQLLRSAAAGAHQYGRERPYLRKTMESPISLLSFGFSHRARKHGLRRRCCFLPLRRSMPQFRILGAQPSSWHGGCSIRKCTAGRREIIPPPVCRRTVRASSGGQRGQGLSPPRSRPCCPFFLLHAAFHRVRHRQRRKASNAGSSAPEPPPPTSTASVCISCRRPARSGTNTGVFSCFSWPPAQSMPIRTRGVA